jgi:hypothetical protein
LISDEGDYWKATVSEVRRAMLAVSAAGRLPKSENSDRSCIAAGAKRTMST